MSRLYRARIEVTCREDTVDERAVIWDAVVSLFPDPPEEEDLPEDGLMILVFEGEMNLSGGTSPDEAHGHIRSTLEGRAVRTKWWYLEREPDHEFGDPEDEE